MYSFQHVTGIKITRGILYVFFVLSSHIPGQTLKEGDVKVEAEIEVMHLQGKECQGLLP